MQAAVACMPIILMRTENFVLYVQLPLHVFYWETSLWG